MQEHDDLTDHLLIRMVLFFGETKADVWLDLNFTNLEICFQQLRPIAVTL